ENGVTAEQLYEEFANDLEAYDEYLSDAEHRLYTPIELPPALQVIVGEASRNRGEELAELADDPAAFLAAVAEHAQTIAVEPLWLPADVARSLGAAMSETRLQLGETLARLR